MEREQGKQTLVGNEPDPGVCFYLLLMWPFNLSFSLSLPLPLPLSLVPCLEDVGDVTTEGLFTELRQFKSKVLRTKLVLSNC